MQDCIFCKIINRDIPAAVVYEDNGVFSFMTNEAINDGHLLVIPKAHIPNVHEMDDATYSKVMLVVKKLSVAVERAFGAEKVGIMVSGWDVPHAHVHVVPMSQPSDITSKKLLDGNGLTPTIEERTAQAQKIADNL